MRAARAFSTLVVVIVSVFIAVVVAKNAERLEGVAGVVESLDKRVVSKSPEGWHRSDMESWWVRSPKRIRT